MIEGSLLDIYSKAKERPTPAQELIMQITEISGYKEITIRKWIDGSSCPTPQVRAIIEAKLNKSIDQIIVEYYERVKQPTAAMLICNRIQKATHKSSSTVRRYANGISDPDSLSKAAIAEEFNTPISILFP
jgi:hypothetical protein